MNLFRRGIVKEGTDLEKEENQAQKPRRRRTWDLDSPKEEVRDSRQIQTAQNMNSIDRMSEQQLQQDFTNLQFSPNDQDTSTHAISCDADWDSSMVDVQSQDKNENNDGSSILSNTERLSLSSSSAATIVTSISSQNLNDSSHKGMFFHDLYHDIVYTSGNDLERKNSVESKKNGNTSGIYNVGESKLRHSYETFKERKKIQSHKKERSLSSFFFPTRRSSSENLMTEIQKNEQSLIEPKEINSNKAIQNKSRKMNERFLNPTENDPTENVTLGSEQTITNSILYKENQGRQKKKSTQRQDKKDYENPFPVYQINHSSSIEDHKTLLTGKGLSKFFTNKFDQDGQSIIPPVHESSTKSFVLGDSTWMKRKDLFLNVSHKCRLCEEYFASETQVEKEGQKDEIATSLWQNMKNKGRDIVTRGKDLVSNDEDIRNSTISPESSVSINNPFRNKMFDKFLVVGANEDNIIAYYNYRNALKLKKKNQQSMKKNESSIRNGRTVNEDSNIENSDSNLVEEANVIEKGNKTYPVPTNKNPNIRRFSFFGNINGDSSTSTDKNDTINSKNSTEGYKAYKENECKIHLLKELRPEILYSFNSSNNSFLSGVGKFIRNPKASTSKTRTKESKRIDPDEKDNEDTDKKLTMLSVVKDPFEERQKEQHGSTSNLDETDNINNSSSQNIDLDYVLPSEYLNFLLPKGLNPIVHHVHDEEDMVSVNSCCFGSGSIRRNKDTFVIFLGHDAIKSGTEELFSPQSNSNEFKQTNKHSSKGTETRDKSCTGEHEQLKSIDDTSGDLSSDPKYFPGPTNLVRNTSNPTLCFSNDEKVFALCVLQNQFFPAYRHKGNGFLISKEQKEKMDQKEMMMKSDGKEKLSSPTLYELVLVQTKICYCIITRKPMFDIHFEFLWFLLANNRLEITSRIAENYANHKSKILASPNRKHNDGELRTGNLEEEEIEKQNEQDYFLRMIYAYANPFDDEKIDNLTRLCHRYVYHTDIPEDSNDDIVLSFRNLYVGVDSNTNHTPINVQEVNRLHRQILMDDLVISQKDRLLSADSHLYDEQLLEYHLPVLLSAIPLRTILLLLGILISEMQVVILCEDLCLLSSTSISLHSLLQPLTWQSIYLPICPYRMSYYLDAPTPFLIGVPFLPPSFRPAQGLVILDLYEGVLRVHPEDLSPNNSNIDDSVRLPHLDELLEQMNSHARILRDKSDVEKRGYKPIYNNNIDNKNAARSIATIIDHHLRKISQKAVKYYRNQKDALSRNQTGQENDARDYVHRQSSGKYTHTQGLIESTQNEAVERTLDTSDSSSNSFKAGAQGSEKDTTADITPSDFQSTLKTDEGDLEHGQEKKISEILISETSPENLAFFHRMTRTQIFDAYLEKIGE